MKHKDVISLVDIASRFAKAKGMSKSGYKWIRMAPGRSSDKDSKVGNSLAVLKAIRAFNASNKKPIKVFKARGYDGTPKLTMVIDKGEVIRLKGFILRGGGNKKALAEKATPFKIVGEVSV